MTFHSEKVCYGAIASWLGLFMLILVPTGIKHCHSIGGNIAHDMFGLQCIPPLQP